jgi:hypothetical protein
MWQQWTNALLGLLVVMLGFLGLSSDTLMWTLAAVGIAIAGIGVWGAMQHDQMFGQYEERRT